MKGFSIINFWEEINVVKSTVSNNRKYTILKKTENRNEGLADSGNFTIQLT